MKFEMSALVDYPKKRRRDVRIPTSSHVYVTAPGKSPCRCELLNISEGGALVQWGCETVPLGPRVTLVFNKSEGGAVQTSRQLATVMRRSGRNIGLMFSPRPETFNLQSDPSASLLLERAGR